MNFKELKSRIVKLCSSSFPTLEFKYLLKEKTEIQKRQLLKQLNLQLKAPGGKPFPTQALIQIVQKKAQNPKNRITLVQGIIYTVLDVYEEKEDDISDVEILSQEKVKRQKYGPWHYYWALLCFPKNSEIVEKRLIELKEELISDGPLMKPPTDDLAKTINAKQNKKESDIISHERSLRIDAEMEQARLNKKIRKLEHLQDASSKENQQLRNELNFLTKRFVQLEQDLHDHHKLVGQLEWEKKQALVKIEDLQKELAEANKSAAEREKYDDGDEKSLSVPEEIPLSINEMVKRVISEVSYNAFTLSSGLKQYVPKQGEARNRIIQSYTLINMLDDYFFHEGINTGTDLESELIIDSRLVLEDEAGYTEVINPAVTTKDELSFPTKKKTKVTGTFYRKDHGGYIIQEDGNTFSIPESMVNAIGLEHEAEVECEPKSRENGSSQQYIRILLQGDNSSAPIDQYLGYIRLGDHHSFYCVEFNDPNNRFPIYHRDVEIQQPNDGDPCLFNVASSGTYARISKIFRNLEEGKEEVEKPLRKTGEKQKKITKETSPFLEGCKVAVIGGQAKWFESVVRETGAEYIHENGEHPERIFAELRKANVLFKLITATSHEAIWSGVEIAKSNGIPHFTIEGSKSNLRSLLWENRRLIKKSKKILTGKEG